MFGQFIKKRVLRAHEWQAASRQTPPPRARASTKLHPQSTKPFPKKSAALSLGAPQQSAEFQQWQPRLGQKMLAVYSLAEKTHVSVLQLKDVQQGNGDGGAPRLTVSELQLSDDVPANNTLQWLPAIELETGQLSYFELLKRELDVCEIPNYRKAIQRLAMVASLLEMEAHLD